MALAMVFRSEVADILGVSPKTVGHYMEESEPGGRYANNPVPQPEGYLDSTAPDGWVPPEQRRRGLRPFWSPESRQAWQQWRDSVPSRDRYGADTREVKDVPDE